MTLTSGQILQSRYRMINLLAQGGFGAVYQGWDDNLGKPIAIKENLDTSPEAQRQFQQEARILSNLSHPNLPRMTDHFFIPGFGQYLVMDFIEGEDLQSMLDRTQRPLPEAHVLAWIDQVCGALEYLHEQAPPIIHRDIKPANIKITPQGKAVLVDFGISKIYDRQLKTTLGARAVTPPYSPPEQYGQGSTDPRSDLYALGATLYMLLTGQEPPESVDRVSNGLQLTPPRQLMPSLSPQIDAAIVRACEVNRTQRFQSVREFRQVLQPSQARLVVTPPPLQASPGQVPAQTSAPSHTPWRLILGGAGALGVLTIIVLLASSNRPVSPVAPVIVEVTRVVEQAVVATQTPMPSTLTAPPTDPPQPPDTPTSAAPTPVSPLGIGSTQVSDKDGMTLLYVPAGEFTMGSNESDDEKPIHKVTLDAFWIDQTEVTNAMFKKFVDATNYQTDAEKNRSGHVFDPAAKDWKDTQGANWQHPRGPSSNLDKLENHPVVQISWSDAQAYCEWAGRHLPTEAEWEKAARGTDERTYPWGNQSVAGNLLNFADRNFADLNPAVDWADKSMDDGYQFTAPVGHYPDGASPYGALDMVGNAWEWVADWYGSYPGAMSANPTGPTSGEQHVLRGGSWGTETGCVRTTDRYACSPNDRGDDFGFRCAQSAKSKPVSALDIYDDFENVNYNGSYDSTRWRYDSDHKSYIAQQNGSLTFTHEVESEIKTALTALAYNEFLLSKPIFFEAKLMRNPATNTGNVQLNLAADDSAWWAECRIGPFTDTQGWASCGDNLATDEHSYAPEGKPVDYDTWHLFRIAIDPRTMTFSYFIDGEKVGAHIPVDADWLRQARFVFQIGIWGPAGTLAGRIDDVRIIAQTAP